MTKSLASVAIALIALSLGCSSPGLEEIRMEGFPWPDPAAGVIAEVPPVAALPVADGALREEVWRQSGPIARFYRGDDASPAETRASAYLISDGTALAVGLELPAVQASPQPKRCYLTSEFDLLGSGPSATICIDPPHRHGSYYQFVIDPVGRREDLRVFDESWSADWTAGSTVERGRWTAEIIIPFAALGGPPRPGDVWGFNIRLAGLSPEGTLSSTPIRIDLVDAERFGHILFRGELSNERVESIKTELPEVHRRQKQALLTANRAMCGPETVEIGNEIDPPAPGEEFKLADGTAVTLLGIDNPEILRSPYPFIYEKYDNPDLTRLRETYGFDKIADSGRNEFEAMLILNHWLVENVEFGNPAPIRPAAQHVIEHGLKGQTFNCTFLSFTLMQIYQSMGWTARKLTSMGHGTLDVWSNYWRKWVQIDPSRDSYYRKDGVPLNSDEVRRERWRNGGVDMEMVYGVEQRAERVTLERRARDGAYKYRQDGYGWIAYKTRNNFFETPYAYRNFLYLIHEDEYNRRKKWMAGDEVDERYLFALRTDRIGDIFWTLNQAHIHLYDKGDGDLTVQLETVTPNFERFEIAVDEGDWTAAEPVFTWTLHPGQNHLFARTVNKFGQLGPEHKVVLSVPEAET